MPPRLAIVLLLVLGAAMPVHAQGALNATAEEPLTIGVMAGANVAGNDFTRAFSNYRMQPILAAFVEYPLGSGFALNGMVHGGLFSTRSVDLTGNYFVYQAMFGGVMASPQWRLAGLGLWDLAPFVQLNTGLFIKKTVKHLGVAAVRDDAQIIPTVGFSLGVLRPLTSALDMRIVFASQFTDTDGLDGLVSGSDHDGYSSMSFGISWRLGSAGSHDAPTGPGERDRDREHEEAADRDGSVADAPGQVEQRLQSSMVISPFHSFSQLRSSPEKLRLRIQKTGDGDMETQVRFLLMKDNAVVAQSMRDHTLRAMDEELDAGGIVDFDELGLAPEFAGGLPNGHYTVTVSVVRQETLDASTTSAEFHLADVAPMFGDKSEGVREMIDRGEAHISSTDTTGSVTLGTYAVPGAMTPSQPPRTPAGGGGRAEAASERHPTPDYAIVRGAMSAAPPEIPEEERAEYIAGKVDAAFKRAQQLLNMAREAGNSRRIPDVVVTMIFFEYGQTTLSEEARTTLEAVAQHLLQHPNFVADIRGYADEVGDETFNLALSRQRAEKAAEHLTRNRVSPYRLSTLPLGKIDNSNARPDRMQQYNRRVEIVLTGVKEGTDER